MQYTQRIRALTFSLLTAALLTVTLLVAGAAALETVGAGAGPTTPGADVDLIKDDGLRDTGLVLRDQSSNSEFHALYLNHFRAAEASFPFQLEEIHIYAATSNLQGEAIQLLVYGDADGGALTNATLLYSETVSVVTESGNNVFVLATPVPFPTATDILIGFSTLYAAGGVSWPDPRYPGSLDLDVPQGDSYLAWMSAPTDPVDVANLAAFPNFIETALTGVPGNLMIRGFGALGIVDPQITLTMTVSTNPNICGSAGALGVGAGTQVAYCFEVANIGNVTFTHHTLTDTALGQLLNDAAFLLAPGASLALTRTAIISATTVSTATWTARESDPEGGLLSASAAAAALVQVVDDAPLACNGDAIGFDNGIPGDWQVLSGDLSPQVFWTALPFSGAGGNYTGGGGGAATASSVAAGRGLYDTELRTNAFSLAGAAVPRLSYLANYQNFANEDLLEVDVSIDGGSSWNPLLSWNEDHPVDGQNQAPGESVVLDLTPFIGEPAVIVRWRYHDPVGPATSPDWYAQIDDVALSCGTGASIALRQTVGTDPAVCAAVDSLIVSPGTTVAYCYEVTNSGPITLTRHDLVDEPLGQILADFDFALRPGQQWNTVTAGLAITATIDATTVNTATWTAYNSGPTDVAVGQAGATVLVNQPAPPSCNGPAVGFDLGIPPDWTVASGGGSPQILWTTIAAAGEAGNYTDGGGGAATASSAGQGNRGLYDTELRSPSIDLSGSVTATLHYRSNYQNLGGVDFLNVAVSTDGGAVWTPLQSWNEDHGFFRSTPGEAVVIDLSAYAGRSGILVRWRYFDPTGPLTSGDWYAQIDDVALTCGSAAPAIALDMTVGSDPTACATTATTTIDAGSAAYYCYAVTNTGTVTLTRHDLTDTRLGSLLAAFPYSLAPGAAVNTVDLGLTFSATISATTISTGTWTAFNALSGSPGDVVAATDRVTLFVATPTDVQLSGFGAGNPALSTPAAWAAGVLCGLAGLLIAARRAAKCVVNQDSARSSGTKRAP